MQLISSHGVKTSDLGFHGNLFGGKLLAWIDAAAAGFAAQACDTPRVVTVLIEKCEFRRPAKAGQLIKIYGKVAKIGTTSILLELQARIHDVYTGQQNILLATNIKFVRIDEQGNPVPISERVHKKYSNNERNT